MIKTLNELIKEAYQKLEKEFFEYDDISGLWDLKTGCSEPKKLKSFLSSTIRRIVKQSLEAVEVEKNHTQSFMQEKVKEFLK